MLTVTGGELASRGANKPIPHDHVITYSISVGIMLSVDLYTGFLAGMGIAGIKAAIAWLNKKHDVLLTQDVVLTKDVVSTHEIQMES
jgi:hypothetical protein